MLIEDVVRFVLEIDKLKAVTRKTKPLGLERYENSAEHSWQLAMFAMALFSFAPAGADLDRVVRMLLVHDLGEIGVGDRFVYEEGGWAEHKSAEEKAVAAILGMLPQEQGEQLLELWREFEHGDTADARFANAIDRAMPMLLNLNNNGQSWRENGISYEQVRRRVAPPIAAGCPELWQYLEQKLLQAKENGLFGA